MSITHFNGKIVACICVYIYIVVYIHICVSSVFPFFFSQLFVVVFGQLILEEQK